MWLEDLNVMDSLMSVNYLAYMILAQQKNPNVLIFPWEFCQECSWKAFSSWRQLIHLHCSTSKMLLFLISPDLSCSSLGLSSLKPKFTVVDWVEQKWIINPTIYAILNFWIYQLASFCFDKYKFLSFLHFPSIFLIAMLVPCVSF